MRPHPLHPCPLESIHPSIPLLSFFHFFLSLSLHHQRIWFVMVTEREIGRKKKKDNVYSGTKKEKRLLMYSLKIIDAVTWKKINLSRHRAQEQASGGKKGVNCEAMTMAVLQMDFSFCVLYWDGVWGVVVVGLVVVGGWEGRKKKQFHQRSSKLSDRGNFDPLALLCSPPTIFPSFTFLSLRSLRGEIPSGQNQHLFSIKCYGAAHMSNTHPDHMLLLCVNTH